MFLLLSLLAGCVSKIDDKNIDAAREGIELPIGEYIPADLAVPMVCGDTTDGYNPSIDEIASFAI